VVESVAGHEENCLIEPLLSADSYENLSSPRVMIIDFVVNATDVVRTITEIQNRSFRDIDGDRSPNPRAFCLFRHLARHPRAHSSRDYECWRKVIQSLISEGGVATVTLM